jgi:hypothetical protein
MRVELSPDLEHCIETVARKKHAELVNVLLGTEPLDPLIQEKLEVLRLFLETADFRKLRLESEKYLVTGAIVSFSIYLDEGNPKYEMHVTNKTNGPGVSEH